MRTSLLTALALTLMYFLDYFAAQLSGLLGVPDLLTRSWVWQPPQLLIDEAFLVLFIIGGYLAIFVAVAIELKTLIRQLFT